MFDCKDFFFRKIEKHDLVDLLEYKKDSWRYTHKTSILNEQNQIKWFEKVCSSDVSQPKDLFMVAQFNSKESLPYHTALFRDNAQFGFFYITDIDYINRSANVSWGVYSILRGKKYGNKLVKSGVEFCFKNMNLRRLNCEIIEYNEPSLKCATNAGFIKEGVKRKSVFKDGEYHDSILLGILDEF
jgi:RimJ/RimL family protein N-acetyltransferase